MKVVPNLVVEIFSDPTAKRDRTEKKDIYERNGVDEYWLVDADRCEITVFHIARDRFDAGEIFSTRRVTSRVLPALALEVNDVFEL